MRNSLRAITMLSSPISINNLKARVVGKINVELDGRILAIPKAGVMSIVVDES